jgi:hypothetical protein
MADDKPKLRIMAESENFDPNDSRWIQQVNALVADLQASVGKTRKEVIPVKGYKGGIETIILALGSAGAITAAVEIFKAWLGRDRTRSLTLSTIKEGKEQTVVVTGLGMSEETIKELMHYELQEGG